MKKINSLILKYGISKDSRNQIKTTCDLYFHLISGYISLALLIITTIWYVQGIYNLIETQAPWRHFLLWQSSDPKGGIKDYTELSMALASVMNLLVLLVGSFFVASTSLFYIVQGIMKFSSVTKHTVIKKIMSGIGKIQIKLSLPSPSFSLCRKLTDEEKTEISKL